MFPYIGQHQRPPCVLILFKRACAPPLPRPRVPNALLLFHLYTPACPFFAFSGLWCHHVALVPVPLLLYLCNGLHILLHASIPSSGRTNCKMETDSTIEPSPVTPSECPMTPFDNGPAPPFDSNNATIVSRKPPVSPLDTARDNPFGKALGGDDNKKKAMVLNRLPTPLFKEYRRKEAKEGRVGQLAGGTWNKMAIMRIHRRNQPKARCGMHMHCNTYFCCYNRAVVNEQNRSAYAKICM